MQLVASQAGYELAKAGKVLEETLIKENTMRFIASIYILQSILASLALGALISNN